MLANTYTVVLALPVAFLGYWTIQILSIWIRLRGVLGVRAPVLANNPISSIRWMLKTLNMQNQNRLYEHFTSAFDRATPQCPNTVEFQVGRRRILMTRDPEQVKTVLTGKFASFGKGKMVHDAASPFLGDSIFTTDGHQWQQSRTLIRPMFVKDRVRDIEIFHSCTEELMTKIVPGQSVDISDLFYRMTLDVTTEFLLGHKVGALENPRSEFSKAFTEVQRMQVVRVILFPFRHLIPLPGYFSGIRTIERFADPYIEATLKLNPSDLEDLSKSDKGFSFLHQIALFSRDPKVIRDQIFAVLIAGRDTTAATLSWAMYEIAAQPAIWQRLREETLDRLGKDGDPTYEDLKGLTFLNHTINETLRLYPAVPYNLRSCLQNATLPGKPGQPDIAVCEGDVIMYSTYAMQRRRDLYPEVSDKFADPAVFSPERWENWTPKPWQFIPFNGGPRICIGQNFAMTEMAFTMVRLLQKYSRVEYRGDWSAQFHKAELVGCPGQGVPVALYED